MRPFGASRSFDIHAFRHLPLFFVLHSRHLPASRSPRSFHGSINATAKGVSTLVRAAPPLHGASDRARDQDAEGDRKQSDEGRSDCQDLNSQQSSASSPPSSSSTAGSRPSPPQSSSSVSGSSPSSTSSPSRAAQPVEPPPSMASSSPGEPKPISCIAKGIKAASGAVKGLKTAERVVRRILDPHGATVLGFGTGCGLAIGFKVAKHVAKGLKFAREVAVALQKKNLLGHSGMASKRMQEHLSNMIKGLNAFYGAFKVLQFAKRLGHQPQAVHLLHWSFLFKGYELSKSVLSVLEVVVKWKGGALMILGKGYPVLKGTVGTLSVVAKAVFLYRELYMVILKTFVIPGGTIAAFSMASKDLFRQSNQMRGNGSIQYVGNMVFSLCPSAKNTSTSLKVRPPSRLFTGDQFSSIEALLKFLSLSSEDKIMDHDSIYPSDIFSLAIPISCGHFSPNTM